MIITTTKHKKTASRTQTHTLPLIVDFDEVIICKKKAKSKMNAYSTQPFKHLVINQPKSLFTTNCILYYRYFIVLGKITRKSKAKPLQLNEVTEAYKWMQQSENLQGLKDMEQETNNTINNNNVFPDNSISLNGTVASPISNIDC